MAAAGAFTGPGHVSRVRVLYKAILRLHRGLPLELKALGDQYVKEEFKRHKACEPQFTPVFMNEWTDYAITMAKQIGKRSATKQLGIQLNDEHLNDMNEEQVGQLYELFKETQKDIDEDNPLGENPSARNEPS